MDFNQILDILQKFQKAGFQPITLLALAGIFLYMNAAFKGVQKDIGALKTDVAVLKTDVAMLKNDVTGLKAEAVKAKTERAEIKTDITWIKGALSINK